MDPDHWKHVSELFGEAIELDPHERERLLADRCLGDSSLRAEVEALIRADGQAGGFLEASTHSSEAPSGVEPASRLGPYRILREIGQGGMGTVYLAARED